MRLSTRGRYAVTALTEMARRNLEAPATLGEIARAQMLSVAYLEQLFARLRRAGLVRSARGPGGGYTLARPASTITVAAVVEAVDDSIAGATGDDAPDMPDEQRALWRELGEQVRFFLGAVTVQDVADGRALGRAVPVPNTQPAALRGAGEGTPLYLDANATEPLRPEARAAALAAMEMVGNPSSVHAEGRAARRVLEEARARVAARFGGAARDVVFTSGGTEANALAIASLARGRRVLAGATEHPAVLRATAGAGVLPVLADGRIDLAALEAALSGGPPALVCLMVAHNETGVIHPVAEAAALCRRHGAALHLDAVQAAGRLPLSFPDTGADSMAISGHKLGGPKGAGALLLRPGLEVAPLVAGGGQERGRRGGTEALPAIAGLGAAAEAADPADAARLAALRDGIEAGLGLPVAGAGAPRLPNTACVVLPGIPAETQVIALDLEGVRVSAGAACSSGKVDGSATLAAMGMGEAAGQAIRVSLPWNAPPDAAARFVAAHRAMRDRLAARG